MGHATTPRSYGWCSALDAVIGDLLCLCVIVVVSISLWEGKPPTGYAWGTAARDRRLPAGAPRGCCGGRIARRTDRSSAWQSNHGRHAENFTHKRLWWRRGWLA